jgi:hypothetical protein
MVMFLASLLRARIIKQTKSISIKKIRERQKQNGKQIRR